MLTRNKGPITAFLVIIFLTGGCSFFPKIMILDDPLSLEEHLNLGLSYEKTGEGDLAEREYLLARPLTSAHLALANIYFQRRSLKKAESYYQKVLAQDLIPQAANNLAWLYLDQGRNLSEAERLANQAVSEAEKRNLSKAEIESYQDTLIKAKLIRARLKSR